MALQELTGLWLRAAVALYGYEAAGTDELTFGEEVTILVTHKNEVRERGAWDVRE